MTFQEFITAATPYLLCVASWLVKQAFGRVNDRQITMQNTITENRRDIQKLFSELDSKVSAAEWLRESGRLRDDVQALGRTLSRIEGALAHADGTTAAIEHLAAAIAKAKQ